MTITGFVANCVADGGGLGDGHASASARRSEFPHGGSGGGGRVCASGRSLNRPMGMQGARRTCTVVYDSVAAWLGYRPCGAGFRDGMCASGGWPLCRPGRVRSAVSGTYGSLLFSDRNPGLCDAVGRAITVRARTPCARGAAICGTPGCSPKIGVDVAIQIGE